MRGLSSIPSPFRNELNKFIHTGSQMLDSIYYMTLKFLKKVKISSNVAYGRHLITLPRTSGFIDFNAHGVFAFPYPTSSR